MRIASSCSVFSVLCLLGAAAGCTASVGGGDRKNGSSQPDSPMNGSGQPSPTTMGSGMPMVPSAVPTVPVAPANAVVGPTMLRRLTNIEYRNTVQTLLASAAPPPEPLQKDALTHGFDNFSASLTVSPSIAVQYADLAAKQALQSFTAPACAAPQTEAQCASSFIASFGKRAFRRPLTAAEQATYEGMYADQRTRADHAGGMRQLVQTMLQSPYLLYRFELGSPGAAADRTLTQYEVATELAYLLTASTPDDTLLAAADTNTLSSPMQIEQQARRLLALPPAKTVIRRFVEGSMETLGLDLIGKNANVYPIYTAQLREALQQETSLFIDSVLWEGDGSFSSLMTAPFSFVNSELSAYYGITDQAQGNTTFLRATLNPAERQGILTQGSVLAAHSKPNESSPVKRGKFIRVGMLCQSLPSPPAIVPDVQPPQPNLTTRERFAAHSSEPACSGCHALIDPLGFGLENYDGVGQFRAMESGKPVNASGTVSGSLDLDGPFTGAVELATKLAASQEAKQCLTLKAYDWAFGRTALDAERAVANTIAQPLAAAGLDIREVMVAITQSNNFLFRTFR